VSGVGEGLLACTGDDDDDGKRLKRLQTSVLVRVDTLDERILPQQGKVPYRGIYGGRKKGRLVFFLVGYPTTIFIVVESCSSAAPRAAAAVYQYPLK
jgi:hypothetical protein